MENTEDQGQTTADQGQTTEQPRETLGQTTADQGQTTEPIKHEWLPEKFKTPEDLVKSYKELETKLGTPQETLDFTKYSQEYNTTGTISDNSIKVLEKQGIPKELITEFISGQQARNQLMETEIKNSIGGDENYSQVVQWASKNLSDEDKQIYDEAVTKSTASAKLAVQGLYQRYRSAVPDEGKLLSGNTGTQGGHSGNAYQSLAQLQKDMRNPDYKTDEAYRKDVMDRLAVSNIL